MQTKKRFKWTGKFSDQRSGKYRVWWSSGAWTLSCENTRISRHDSSEQAKRKASKHHKAMSSEAKLDSISTQTRHDIAASVVRHSNLSIASRATVEQSPPAGTVTISVRTGYKAGPSDLESAPIQKPPRTLHIEFDAVEYEQARDADPDPRDDEDQKIEGLILMASASLSEECARSGETPILIAHGREKDEDRTILAREAAP